MTKQPDFTRVERLLDELDRHKQHLCRAGWHQWTYESETRRRCIDCQRTERLENNRWVVTK